jgi:predicted Zn-dependent peptidase
MTAVSRDAGSRDQAPARSATVRAQHPGLAVWTQPTRTLQTICLTFGRGQRDEGAGREGLAHLVEHLFHCRGDLGTGQFFSRLAGQGAVANAYTGADYIQFWAAVPVDGLPAWARTVAQQLTAPDWSRSTVIREHQVIGQEVASKVTDHPHRGFCFQHVRTALFADHQNRHAGFIDNRQLLDLTMAQLHEAFDWYLDPGLLTVTSVGPLGYDEVAAEIVGPLLPAAATSPGLAVGRSHRLGEPNPIRLERDPRSPHAEAVVFPVELSDGDPTAVAAHQVIAALLAQGRGSMLARHAPPGALLTARLGIGSDPNEDRSPSSLSVESTVRTATDHGWLRPRLDELLNSGRPEPGQVHRARQYVLHGTQAKFETALQLARSTAWLSLWGRGGIQDYLAALEEVEVSDLEPILDRLRRHGGTVISL